MWGTRGRKIVRDIVSRKGRTLLVALSIMIGVFGAVTLLAANDLIIRQIHKDIRSEEVPHVRLYVTVPSAGTEVNNDAYLQLIDGLPGVKYVEGQVETPVFW
jgi:hypothetical protein